jgi:hypothetical protein
VKPRIEIEDPISTCSATLSDPPNRANDRSDIPLPIVAKEKTLTLPPTLVMQRIDSDEPIDTVSKTLLLAPSCCFPNTLIELPNRAKLRILTLLPTIRLSKRLTRQPTRP